jgi:sphingomyelin phosphodiesterase acid-like 3
MVFWPARLAAVAFCVLLLASTQNRPAPSRADAQTWLAISDIHLDPFDRSSRPSRFTFDSNAALLRSAIDRMKRAVPDPAVILIPGDFLVHHFADRVRGSGTRATPDQAGLLTMQLIASSFARAFPKAQFAIALGNNDSPCGDYRSADGSPYLARVARIWAPLVDRNHSAPDFAASFARGAHYTQTLPVAGLRLVVPNSLLFSQEYRGNCGAPGTDPANELGWLRRALRNTRPGDRNVIMMHIPPGFDPFSTQYVKGFLAWPFLRARYDRSFTGILEANVGRIAYAIAGHAHRFDFRLAGEVPIVVLGSLSPVLRNNPAFYTLRVASDGSLGDIGVHTFDEPLQKWLPGRSFDAVWGTTRIDAASLARLHGRLGADPALRRAWGAQSAGWPDTEGTRAGAWGTHWWRVQWCAQTSLGPQYAACAQIQGRVRLLRILLIASVVALIVVAALLVARRARLRPRAG